MKPSGYNLYTEIAKCLACRSCEIACALEHSQSGDLFQAIAENPPPAARVSVEAVAGAAIPLQCRHCEDAPCVTVCPTRALHRQMQDQPVLIDEERCIGCKLCVMVCPFGVIALRPEGKVALKCDLCLNRVEQGERPACVSACPTGALEFVSLDEVARRKRKQAAADSKEAQDIARTRK